MVNPKEIISKELKDQGAAFPDAGAELIVQRLKDNGISLVETRLLLAWQL